MQEFGEKIFKECKWRHKNEDATRKRKKR